MHSMLTKICRTSESSLLFSYENTVTEGTNLRPVKAVHRDQHFLSLALSEFCLNRMRKALLTGQKTNA